MKKHRAETEGKEDLAALVSFCVDSEKFKSNYQRNKFYRGLYGWKQKVKKGDKVYVYNRSGILKDMPHIKVDRSVYIVPLELLDRVVGYLDGWEGKIDYDVFKVLVPEDRFKKMNTKESREDWVEVEVK